MPALESQLLSRQPHVPGKVTSPLFALVFPLKLGTMTTTTTKTHLTVVIVNSRKRVQPAWHREARSKD